MFLLQRKLHEETKVDIPVEAIWNYMESRWDLKAAVNNNLIDDNSPF